MTFSQILFFSSKVHHIGIYFSFCYATLNVRSCPLYVTVLTSPTKRCRYSMDNIGCRWSKHGSNLMTSPSRELWRSWRWEELIFLLTGVFEALWLQSLIVFIQKKSIWCVLNVSFWYALMLFFLIFYEVFCHDGCARLAGYAVTRKFLKENKHLWFTKSGHSELVTSNVMHINDFWTNECFFHVVTCCISDILISDNIGNLQNT